MAHVVLPGSLAARLPPARPVPRCADRTAYVSLLTVHNRTGGKADSTFIARSHTNRGRTGTQLKLLLARHV